MSFPHVSSEGGPIILGDFEALRAWRGNSGSCTDYDTACQFVRRANPSPIRIGDVDCLVWDFGGAGTGDIIRVSDAHVSVVRIWPDATWTEPQTEAAIVSAATARYGTSPMARLTFTSGYLLALWATEDASEFLAPRGEQGVPGPGLSIGDGGTYVRIARGTYAITACEWQTGDHDINKLDLRALATQG